MFQPLADNPLRTRVSEVKNFPAPVGGWVSDSAFNGDIISTARILRNIVPNQRTASVRFGSQPIAQVAGAVNTLMSYQSGAAKKLLAAAADKVFEIPVISTFSGLFHHLSKLLATPVELKTGLSNSKWQYVSMANAADVVRLVCVNGQDGMHTYDGTAFARHTPTSGDKLTFSNITEFKGRLWCTDLGSSIVYYGDPLSNTPATMTPFPVGPFLRKGGSIVCIDSLSVDGGSGPDDYLVMVSDRGEIVMWQGIDPADDLSLVGVFAESKPLGFRCLKKSGTDLLYFSEAGPNYISRLLPAAEGASNELIVPIRTEFEDAISKMHLAFGWDFTLYSKRSWVLFNIPIVPPTVMGQFCMNMESNAWFEITDWNAQCWVQHDHYILFGDPNGFIVVADYGGTDRGNSINFDYMQSWYEFETSAKKKFNMAQMTIKSNTRPDIAVDIMVDYEEVLPQSTPNFGQKAASSPWNISPWNTSPWSGSEQFYVNTFGLSDIGFVGALRYRGSLNEATHQLFGFRIAFEEGEIL